MRKSNFFKKSFSSGGNYSPHFQVKRLVTFNILILLIAGFTFFNSQQTVKAVEPDKEDNQVLHEVTLSVPTELMEEITDMGYTLDDCRTYLCEDVIKLRDISNRCDVIIGLLGYVFGALLLIIICIAFIAFYKLFNTFFRF